MAPIIFHFGHYPFVLELFTLGQELAETVGIYFLAFILFSAVIFYRNYLFLLYNKMFFRFPNENRNTVNSQNNSSSFFGKLRKSPSMFFSKIRAFFGKK